MTSLTARTLLTNFNATYAVLPFLGFFTVAVLLMPSDRMLASNLMISLSLVTATAFGLLCGTTVTEIKVKPLSYVIPGQERSMAPAVIAIGAFFAFFYALLLAAKPMTVTEATALQQAFASFAYSLTVYLLVVGVCIVSRDTGFVSLATAIPFVLVAGALAHQGLASAWVSLNLALIESPMLGAVLAVAATAAVIILLGDRKRSRRLCGAPFVPLKVYDNPFKADELRSRIRAGTFRPSFMTSAHSSPTGMAIAALSKRRPGSLWDAMIQDPRLAGNLWEFLIRVSTLVVIVGLMTVLLASERVISGLGTVQLLVAMTFIFFAPTFRAALSPMLPHSRRTHFQSFLAKAFSVYVLTILFVLVLKLVAQAVDASRASGLAQTIVAVAGLPFAGVLLVAAQIPILCWAFATLKSTFGFILFMMLYFGVAMNLTAQAAQTMISWGEVQILAGTAVAWLPFIAISWKRCFRDDLLRY
jgi:hypothetical protein